MASFLKEVKSDLYLTFLGAIHHANPPDIPFAASIPDYLSHFAAGKDAGLIPDSGKFLKQVPQGTIQIVFVLVREYCYWGGDYDCLREFMGLCETGFAQLHRVHHDGRDVRRSGHRAGEGQRYILREGHRPVVAAHVKVIASHSLPRETIGISAP